MDDTFDEADFEESRDFNAPPPRTGAAAGGSSLKKSTSLVKNQPHDEAIELSSDSRSASRQSDDPFAEYERQAKQGDGARGGGGPLDDIDGFSEGDIEDHSASSGLGGPAGRGRRDSSGDDAGRGEVARPSTGRGRYTDDGRVADMTGPGAGPLGADPPSPSDRSMTAGEQSTDLETSAMEPPEGAYDPQDYEHLQVSGEVKELFSYIGRYKPLDIDLPAHMDPFVPEFLPAAGDLEAFLTVPRPDGRVDGTGINVVREPNVKQTDKAVLTLKLRQKNKTAASFAPVEVKAVANADAKPGQVENWVQSIQQLHNERPPAHVVHTHQMPDIPALMQVWPAEFEDMLSTVKLPPADLDVSLQEYCEIVCALLDIPVRDNVVESLHVLLSLFTEFRQTQAMMHGGAGPGAAGGAFGSGPAPSHQMYMPGFGGPAGPGGE
eukprot:TRINITY_DN1163_c1_g1_i2.p1 TRINITY_DN1163_c1_g1~~TRINITY_DN1163_c1_g1_i2.p1  ORF type:complete len:436 (-),score=98.82 TRINITY_DN1163_c1_g1_i2:958-2265(-)